MSDIKQGGTAGYLSPVPALTLRDGIFVFIASRVIEERKVTIMSNQIPYKIYIEESEMPRAWYNLRADMKNKPEPLLDPKTLKPM